MDTATINPKKESNNKDGKGKDFLKEGAKVMGAAAMGATVAYAMNEAKAEAEEHRATPGETIAPQAQNEENTPEAASEGNASNAHAEAQTAEQPVAATVSEQPVAASHVETPVEVTPVSNATVDTPVETPVEQPVVEQPIEQPVAQNTPEQPVTTVEEVEPVDPNAIAQAIISENMIDPNDINMEDVVNFESVGTVHTIHGEVAAAQFVDPDGNELLMVDLNNDNVFDVVTDSDLNVICEMPGVMTVDDAEVSVTAPEEYVAMNDNDLTSDFGMESIEQDMIS